MASGKLLYLNSGEFDTLHFLESALKPNTRTGGFGGICTVIVGHPLDTIKVRLQAVKGIYNGTMDAFIKILSREGIPGLYKGVSAPLITVVPMFALSLVGFGFGKQLVAERGQTKLSDMQLFSAGMFSGGCTSFITIPAERIKCLLQLQGNGVKRYDGFMDCTVKLWKEGGIRNLYIGTWATLLRDIPSTGVYFYSYDRVLRHLVMQPDEVTWQPLVAGGFAGIVNWAIAMPPDVLKTRLQIAPFGKYERGMRSVLPVIIKEDGLYALYRGVIPVMIRAVPANAACFLGIEMALTFLGAYAPTI